MPLLSHEGKGAYTVYSMPRQKVKDKLFAAKKGLVADFNFGTKTAAVFDDMLNRSVPFYPEMVRMTGEIAADFAVEGTSVYDLGCSTGTTFLMLDPLVPKGVRFIGVDSSAEMIQRAKAKMKEHGIRRPVEFVCADLNKGIKVTNASVVIMNLTLQFIRPLYRHTLLTSIHEGLATQGAFIAVEKVVTKDSMLNRLFIKYYYAFKQRQGYSKLEIAQKREALENVLVPYRLEENMELLKGGGFSECDVFFKWYNFCGLIALK